MVAGRQAQERAGPQRQLQPARSAVPPVLPHTRRSTAHCTYPAGTAPCALSTSASASWWLLVVAPEQLRQIKFDTVKERYAPIRHDRCLPLVQGLCAWLVRHAVGATHELGLRVGCQPRDTAHGNAFVAEVMGSVAALGAGGSLRQVRLDIQCRSVSLPSWAAALHGLRQLHIDVVEGSLKVGVPLAALSNLQDLRLDAESLSVTAAATLPASLTKLHLGGLGFIYQETSLPSQVCLGRFPACVRNPAWRCCTARRLPHILSPSQVPTLPHLRHLSLETSFFSVDNSLSALAQLASSLQRLHLNWCSW